MEKFSVKKITFLIIGIISLILGIIGIVIPVLPTTPFLILSAYCFSQSYDKFNKWFIKTKIYKKYLENFVRAKSMTKKNKILLLSSVSVMLICVIFIVKNIVATIIISLALVIKYVYFIFFIKTI